MARLIASGSVGQAAMILVRLASTLVSVQKIAEAASFRHFASKA
jgi:hypothetical protein